MYIVRAESVDGTIGFVSLEDDEELAEFIATLKLHPQTHRYAVIREDSLEYVVVNPAWTRDDFDQAAREAGAALEEKLKEDPDYGKHFPVAEVGGFKFVDASGQSLPPEIMEALAEAMEASGQLKRDENGNLVQGDSKPKDGALMGIEINVGPGGVSAGQLFDISKKKLN